LTCCGTPSTELPRRGSKAGATDITVSGTPLPATACGAKAGARFASEGNCVGDAGTRLAPGICPCGIGVPGTLGPKPAGLASGEPGGAMLAGNCAPGTRGLATPGNALGGVPGSAANMALAMRARTAGSNGASPGIDGVLLTAAYL
jgi:hypothetical protein